MYHHVHHVHLFASDIRKSLEFYQDFFGGKIILDMEVAGARNVLMKVGTGRIHFYDQPPKVPLCNLAGIVVSLLGLCLLTKK